MDLRRTDDRVQRGDRMAVAQLFLAAVRVEGRGRPFARTATAKIEPNGRIPPMKLLHRLLAGAVLALSAPAAAQDCDRACLIKLADDYAAALVAHDPSRVPLAANVVTVENVKKIARGEGLWRTATAGPTAYRIHVPDPVSQQVGLLAMMQVEGKPALV